MCRFRKLLKCLLLLSEEKWSIRHIASMICTIYVLLLIITILLSGIKSYDEDDWSWDDITMIFHEINNINNKFGAKVKGISQNVTINNISNSTI